MNSSTIAQYPNSLNGSSDRLNASSWLFRFSLFQTFAVLCLIFLGGHVKSHEAGLSVPDWPTSYGYNMFTFPMSLWKGGIFYEHVHRLVASAVGTLTVGLAIWVWASHQRRSLRVLSLWMVGAVLLQGLLGGLTVILQLPTWTSSAHGLLAQIFLCLSVCMAYGLSSEWRADAKVQPICVRYGFLLLAALFAQLLLGALVRHTESGLAIPDFPTMAGSLIPSTSDHTVSILNAMRAQMMMPPVEAYQVLLQLLHRGWAVGVTVIACLLFLVARSTNSSRLQSTARVLIGLISLQLALGVSIILTTRMPVPTSLHVMIGAALLATTTLFILRARNE